MEREMFIAMMNKIQVVNTQNSSKYSETVISR